MFSYIKSDRKRITKGKSMDKKKAYELINQALAQINTSRQGHLMLQQALTVLYDETPKKPELVAPEKESKAKTK